MPDPENAAPKAAEPADLTGRTLGDFKVVRRIGSGGMGQVYLARQLSLKRDVALKLLRGEMADNPTALARFQAEAEAVARLSHPNIVQVYAVGEADGLRYMALEYVDGRNLRDYVARKGPPELAVTLSVMRQVASALQKAHEVGLIHRDIKPENILVTRKVEVKVTDFGLSRFFAGEQPATNLTQSGVTLGTPLYMSPEQVQGKPLDHRTDIYSFGVSCYHLLAGEPPFRGASAFDVALKHVQENPRPLSELRPDLPPDLCGMVHKMMAKHPADRYQTARDILRDLAKVREGLNLGLAQAAAGASQSVPLSLSGVTPTPSVPVAALVPQPVRWGRWVLAVLGCVLAGVGGVFVYAALNPPPEPPPPEPRREPTAGLPDVGPREKLTTTARERELLAVLATRNTLPETVISASVELGLLYVRERRPDEAEKRFEALAREKLDGAFMTPQAVVAGRLGQAVVLSYRDEWRKSNEAVVDVLTGQLPSLPPPNPKKGERLALVQAVLQRHPDLAQAVAEALNRNAANQGVAKLTPPSLELLRTPRAFGKKE